VQRPRRDVIAAAAPLARGRPGSRRFFRERNVRLDPQGKLAHVGYGDGALAVIDPQQMTKVGDVKLVGHPDVSLLLCGLDASRERADALGILAAHRLPVPPDIGVKLDRHQRRPLLFNVFYNLVFWTDPVVATVSPMLAHNYFASLGINVELDG
jgi:hypothetical protein